MKRQMARSGAGLEFNPWLLAWFEFSGRRIKSIDHYFVDAEVSGKRVSFGSVENDAMSMRAFLLLFDARAFVLLEIDRRCECAVRSYWQDRNTAARVISHK